MMIAILFLLGLLQPAQFACTTFATGAFRKFSYNDPSWDCKDFKQVYGTIAFEKEFCERPQVVMSLENIARASFSSFSFKIVSVTTKDFSFFLLCNSALPIFAYTFEWKAIVDNRIIVINDYMQALSMTDNQSQLFPYPNSTPNLYTISYNIVSFSGGYPRLRVQEYSDGYKFTNSGAATPTQLSGLGIQIVLGVNSIYFKAGELGLNCNQQAEFGAAQKYWADHTNNYPVMTSVLLYDEATGNSCYEDRQYTLLGCRVSESDCQSRYYQEFLLYFFVLQSKPHYYQKIRVSHVMRLDNIMTNFKTQKLQLKETDQTFSDESTASIPTIKYDFNTLSLVYYHQCQPNRKITITVLKNGASGEYNYTFSHYCHRLYNLITMFFYFNQSPQSASDITIALTNPGVTISEKLSDRTNTLQLLTIQYV